MRRESSALSKPDPNWIRNGRALPNQAELDSIRNGGPAGMLEPPLRGASRTPHLRRASADDHRQPTRASGPSPASQGHRGYEESTYGVSDPFVGSCCTPPEFANPKAFSLRFLPELEFWPASVMGVGGKFWDMLSPCARQEGPGFLRGKRVAVDLPFWLVQHDTAIRARSPSSRSPHLRTTFFRAVLLFSKMGAYPVFVVDGDPSPMKARARAERFFRASGMDPRGEFPATAGMEKEKGEGSVATPRRNRVFARCLEECVELLKLLGMPVLTASGEAEALCAQLNADGHVDACISRDSDTLLFGAQCVIKTLNSNSREPFECYLASDIESKLGLGRNQLVAIALLVGNDYDVGGVPGFGVETALRFIRLFNEADILDRLREVGKGNFFLSEQSANAIWKVQPHCSNCGHSGSKNAHSESPCSHRDESIAEGCVGKPKNFSCTCTPAPCGECQEAKQRAKHKDWHIKVCNRIAAEKNFPNEDIIHLYLDRNHKDDGLEKYLRWVRPDVESLVDFLAYHLGWEPGYVRRRMLPVMSTIYLREVATAVSGPSSLPLSLLCDQYEFHSVRRLSVHRGHPFCVVWWRRAACPDVTPANSVSDEEEAPPGASGSGLYPDETDGTWVLIDDEDSRFLLTEEDPELVGSAFPDEMQQFLNEQNEKELKKTKGKKKLATTTISDSTSLEPLRSSSSGVQLSITEFFRSNKSVPADKNKKRSTTAAVVNVDKSIPKSVRRRLLFG